MWRRQKISWHMLDLGLTYDAILSVGWINEVNPILLHLQKMIVFWASLQTVTVVTGKKLLQRAAEEASVAYTLALGAVTA